MASGDESGPRRLGPTETFYQLLIDKYNASYYFHISIIKSSHKLSDGDVKKAFEVLCGQHEALRMCIVPIEDEEHAYRYEPMKEPCVDFYLTQITKKSDWPQLLSDDNQTQMDCLNGPIWKVTMAHIEENSQTYGGKNPLKHQCLILLKMHHAIADAKSITDFMYLQFMPVLSAVTNNDPVNDLIPEVPLYKSTEELFARKPFHGGRHKVPWLLSRLFDFIRWKNRTFQTSYNNQFFFPEEAKEESLSQLSPCQPKLFTKELSSSIFRAAKANGVTVHCVLLAVNSIALCKTAKAAGIELPNILKQSSPIDLRKYLNWKRPQPIGAHTSIFETATNNQIEYSVKEFWKMCKDIKSDAFQKVTKEKSTAMLGVVQYFVDEAIKTDLMKIISEFGLAALSSVSNPGVCDLGAPPVLSKGDVIIDLAEQYFTVTGMHRLNSTPFVHYVLTFKGRISWNFTFNIRNVGRRFVDEYLQNLEDTFRRYCGESEV